MGLRSEYGHAIDVLKEKEDAALSSTRAILQWCYSQGIIKIAKPNYFPLSIFKLDGESYKVIEYKYLQIKARPFYVNRYNFTKEVISNSFINCAKDYAFYQKMVNGKTSSILGVDKFVLSKTITKSPVVWFKDRGLEEGRAQSYTRYINTHFSNTTPAKILTTPEEYSQLCDDNTGAFSCMGVSSGSHSSTFRTFMWRTYKLWPSLFYHYCPFMAAGAVKLPNGKTKARGTINLVTGTKSVYGNDGLAREHVNRVLDNHFKENKAQYGIFSIPSFKCVTEEVTYDICPFAYLDVIPGYFFCEFDQKKEEFVFSFPQPVLNTSLGSPYNYTGWLIHRGDGKVGAANHNISTGKIKNVRIPY